jgi:hypothetical protein
LVSPVYWLAAEVIRARRSACPVALFRHTFLNFLSYASLALGEDRLQITPMIRNSIFVAN